MAKNDVVVRSAADLERKYNLTSLLGLSKNIEINKQGMQKIENELYNFINSTLGDIEDLQTQIDGKVTTWYHEGEPTLSNIPAVDWDTSDLKNEHVGDLYYDKNTGYSYIFQYDTEYFWLRIEDQDIIESLAIANAAKDTADSKRHVFIVQPTTPYDTGDLWIKEDEIFVCQVTRKTGNFNANDWINNLKYTDDTRAEAVGEDLIVLEGTVQTITETYVKFTDLSTGGSTTISGDNIVTGTIDASRVRIANDNVVLDTDGIKLNNGAKVVGENGLMNTYLFGSASERPFIGYLADLWGESIAEESIAIEFAIPEGLEVTKAKVHLFHNPVFWHGFSTDGGATFNGSAIGYSRNVKLYNATNLGTRRITAAYGSEYTDDDTTTYNDTGITWYNSGGSSLGNAFTPSIPTSSSYSMEEAITSDFSNIFKSNGTTQPGKYQLKITSSDSINSTWSIQECAARTGRAYAILEIEGYMTYT